MSPHIDSAVLRLAKERNEARKCYKTAMELAARYKSERDEARDTVSRLRKQRAIARNFGDQMERERDEAIQERERLLKINILTSK